MCGCILFKNWGPPQQGATQSYIQSIEDWGCPALTLLKVPPCNPSATPLQPLCNPSATPLQPHRGWSSMQSIEDQP